MSNDVHTSRNKTNHIGILTFTSGSLLEAREEITTPEAHSPFVAPTLQTRDLFREDVGNGSPIAGHNYTKSGSLFVVNPSATPKDSPTAAQGYFHPAPQGFSKLGGEITVKDLGAGESASRNIPGYRGSSGVFPTILTSSMSYDQGALAPQIRPNIIDSTRDVPILSVPPPTAQQKKSLFNRSKQPAKPNIRSLAISKPVMNEDPNASQQPFARIQTIDLAQAAVNERERREAAADRSRLIANRPAPQPPQQFTFPAEEGLRKSISVKRKEMPNRPSEPMPTIASSASSGLSVDAANGSTTSASLSPGREEVRRRSPRSVNTFGGSIDEKARPLPTLQRKQTIGLPSNPRATRIVPAPPVGKEQTVMFMNDIVYDNPGIVKTIIKGAPEIYALAQRAKTAEESPTASYRTDLKSSGSIIHRPRPYRRDSAKDRTIFPPVPSPRHKRSKSGSSITTRKSLLMSHPGSPTQLPPLPPPPTSASKLKRLLPNDTKSMTFDEKIQLLFPAPPGASVLHNRRSSVPSLPLVPSVFMSETPATQSPTQEEQQSRRASKRTTIASFGMPDVPVQATKDDSSKGQERQTYRFSANTYRTLADQVGETWIPGIPVKEANIGSLAPDVTDMDSHITRSMRQSNMTGTSSSNMSTDDDSTYWGSIHSEIPPVDLSKVMRNANSTFIQRSRAGTLDEVKPSPALQAEELQHGEEIMTVMLECEEGCKSTLPSADDNRQSFFLDVDQALPGDKTATKTWHRRIGDELPTFSERKAKTRSRKMPPPTPLLLSQRGRGATVVVREALPSPPMMDSPEKAIAEIQAQLKRFEEPSRGSVGSLLRHIPDATSRGDVNEDHNDRLRLLENLENEMGQQENQWQQMQSSLDRDSISSITTPQAPAPSVSEISRESSQRSSRAPSRAVSRRARIRSSMTLRSKGDESTLSTSTQSSDNSRASVWQQRLAEAQMEYMENAPVLLRKRSLNFLSVSKSHQLGSPTPPDTDSGTDMETDSEVEFESDKASFSVRKEPVSLWEARLSSPKAAVGRMWNPPYETMERAASPEPPAKSIRPAQRKVQSALRISSSNLWVKPASSANNRSVVGLWGSRLTRPVSIRTRPVTQRPPRKSKRVTFLPDIGTRLSFPSFQTIANNITVESPIPLPNKRDTLGIFQFPWGETSDSAVYQPAFNPVLLSGPILNAKLDARSRQLEPEHESEYSSSFFDDYDEDVDEDEDPESDDDFDETTLWEIASLLKSEDVPSKNSLLLGNRSVIEDYDEETDFEDSEDEGEAVEKVAKRPETKLPIMPLAMGVKEEQKVEAKTESKLWASDMAATLAALNASLPQPEEQVWKAYIPSSEDTVRSKPRASELPVLASQDLWIVSESEVTSLSTSPMWIETTISEAAPDATSTVKAVSKGMWTAQPEQAEVNTTGLFSLDAKRSEFRTTQAIIATSAKFRAPRSSNAAVPSLTSQSLWTPEQALKKATIWTSAPAKAPAQAMWAPAARISSVVVTGLFSLSHARQDFRTTSQLPAAIDMTLKSRASSASLSTLTSSGLWSAPSSLPYEHHWISESSIRPVSPSVYSETSSGRSSPASETSSISGLSLKSTSTKASSLWGSIKSASTHAWWDTKGSRKIPSPPPTGEDAAPGNWKFASKIPVGKGLGGLAPVRESRVLASRDMWEAKSPVSLGETPKRNFRKAAVVKKKILERPVASKGDWDFALKEAIAMGTIQPAKVEPFDPAVLHPVFFTTSLVSTTSNIHPAAIGHVQRVKAMPEMWAAALEEAIARGTIATLVKGQKYDPAVLHPVFFTSNMVSNSKDVHPAAIGHVVRPQVPPMWTPRSHTAVLDAPIGAMWKKGKVAAAQFEHDETPTIRKASVSRSVSLPKLESANVWQPVQSSPVEERNWIVGAKSTRAQTWTAPKPVVEKESKAMWAPKTSTKFISPDMFTNITGSPFKKSASRTAALPTLTSTELFTPSPAVSNESTHWLRTTSTSASRTAPSAGMWMAPKKAGPPKKDGPDMFAHVKGEYVKKATAPRPAPLSRLNSFELFAPTSKVEGETHWLHSTSSSSTSTPTLSNPVPLSAPAPKPIARSRAQTWTAPRPNISTSKSTERTINMWTCTPATKVDNEPTMFEDPHKEPWSRKKRSDSGVDLSMDGLESREMWSYKYVMPESPKGWLVRSEKRIGKVQFRY